MDALEENYVFPKPKQRTVYLRNEMAQSIKVEARYTEDGIELFVYQRHMLEGQMLGPGRRFKVEEE